MRKIIFFIFLISFFFNYLDAQTLPKPCSSCDCNGLFTSCGSGLCCPPESPKCDCGAFTSKCRCARTKYNHTNLHLENVALFIEQLNDGNKYQSNNALVLKQNLQEWISLFNQNDQENFLIKGDEIEILAGGLPEIEKNYANTWITSKGNYILIQ